MRLYIGVPETIPPLKIGGGQVGVDRFAGFKPLRIGGKGFMC